MSTSSKEAGRSPSIDLATDKKGELPFLVDGLTSSVFNTNNPPKDWCDIGLLIPHEAIRREMMAMVESAGALEANYDDSKDDWRILYFAEWFVDIFAPSVHDHHENEENIYFPWIATKAEIPEKKMAQDHKALMKLMDEIGTLCENVITKKGKKCSDEIKQLQEKMPLFETQMGAHLQEEEETIPELLRKNFTHEEEAAVVAKIVKNEGLHGCKTFVPCIIFAMRKWATPEFIEEFKGNMPPPIRSLVDGYYIPDFETFVYPKRNAPLLDSKPKLSKVGCCKIPFCFPCIL